MKKIIIEEKKHDVTFLSEIYDADGYIFAYRSKSNNTNGAICMLYHVRYNQWGFIPLNNCNGSIRYSSDNWRDSVKMAINGKRTVYMFEDVREFYKALYCNSIQNEG